MTNDVNGPHGVLPAHGTELCSCPHGTQHTVLVVDDEEALQRVVQVALGARFNAIYARNTREADALLLEHPIQVVVCDHLMPGENGLDFLVRMRQSHPLVSRILLTGCDDRETILAAINRSGVCRYLTKPVCLGELLQAVEDATRLHASAARYAGLGKDNADLRSSLHRLLSRSAAPYESPVKLLAVSLLGLVTVLAAALFVGLLVFVVLYALKSALGIDFFPNWSHSEVL